MCWPNLSPRHVYTASAPLNDTDGSFCLSYGKGSAAVEYVIDVENHGCELS